MNSRKGRRSRHYGLTKCGAAPSVATKVTVILFALHPIHTEAVSGIVGCADLLSCVWTQLSFIAYTK